MIPGNFFKQIFVLVFCTCLGIAAYAQTTPIFTPATCINSASGSTENITITNYPGNGNYILAYVPQMFNAYSNFLQTQALIISSVTAQSNGQTCVVSVPLINGVQYPAAGYYTLAYKDPTGKISTPSAAFLVATTTVPVLTVTANGSTNTVVASSPITVNMSTLYGYDCVALSATPSSTIAFSLTNPQSYASYTWSFGTAPDGQTSNGWTATGQSGTAAPYTLNNTPTLTLNNFNNQPGIVTLTTVDPCGNTSTYSYTIGRFLPIVGGSMNSPEPGNLYTGLVQFDKTTTAPGAPVTAYIANMQAGNPASLTSAQQNLQANLNTFTWTAPAGWTVTPNANGTTTFTPPATAAAGSYTVSAHLNASYGGSACYNNVPVVSYTINIDGPPVVTPVSCVSSVTGSTANITVNNYPGNGSYVLTYVPNYFTAYTNFLQTTTTISSVNGQSCVVSVPLVAGTHFPAAGYYTLTYKSPAGVLSAASSSFLIATTTVPVLTVAANGVTNTVVASSPISVNMSSLYGYDCVLLSATPGSTIVFSLTNPQSYTSYTWSFGTGPDGHTSNGWTATGESGTAAPYTLSNAPTLTLNNFNNQPGIVTLTTVDPCGNTNTYSYTVGRYLPYAGGNMQSPEPNNLYTGLVQFDKTTTAPGVPVTAYIANAQAGNPASLSLAQQNLQANLNTFAWTAPAGWTVTPNANGTTTFTPPATAAAGTYTVSAQLNGSGPGTSCYNNGPIVTYAITVSTTALLAAPSSCVSSVTGSTANITVSNYPGTGSYVLTYVPNYFTAYTNFLQTTTTTISSVSGQSCVVSVPLLAGTHFPAAGYYTLTYKSPSGVLTAASSTFLIASTTVPVLTVTANGSTNTVVASSPITVNMSSLYGYDCVALSATPGSTIAFSLTNPQSYASYTWSFGTGPDGHTSNGWTATGQSGTAAPYTLSNTPTLTLNNFNNQPGIVTLTTVDPCGNTNTYSYTVGRYLPYAGGNMQSPEPGNLYTGLVQFDKTTTAPGVPVTAYIANMQAGNPASLTSAQQNLQANLNTFAWAAPAGWTVTPNANGTTTITPPATAAAGSYTVSAQLNAGYGGTACYNNGPVVSYTITIDGPPVVAPASCVSSVAGSTANITVSNYPGNGSYVLTYVPNYFTIYTNFLQTTTTISSVNGQSCVVSVPLVAGTTFPAAGYYTLTYKSPSGVLSAASSSFLIATTTLPVLTVTAEGTTNTVTASSPIGLGMSGFYGYDCVSLSQTPGSTIAASLTNPQNYSSYTWSFGTSPDGHTSNGWTAIGQSGTVAPYTLSNTPTLTLNNFNNQPGVITLTTVDLCGNSNTYAYVVGRYLPYLPSSVSSLISFNSTCTTPGSPITASITGTGCLQASLNPFAWTVPAGWTAATNANGTVTITPSSTATPGSYTISVALNAASSNSACYNNGNTLSYTIYIRPSSVSIAGNTSLLTPGTTATLIATPSSLNYSWSVAPGGALTIPINNSYAYYTSATSNATITAMYTVTPGCVTSASVQATVAPSALPATVVNANMLNAVRVIEAKAPFSSEADVISSARTVTDVTQTTQYSDGFGRSVQTIIKQQSPLGNDEVVAQVYNAIGQEQYKYLPFASNVAKTGDVTTDGNYKTDALQQQVDFYNTYLTDQPGETNIGANNLNWAYGKDNFEASPLERVTSVYSPGANWVGSESTPTQHSRQQRFVVNTSTDNVQIWNIGAWSVANPEQNIIPVNGGAYATGKLYKTIAIDEQGHQTVEFNDMYGQLILKKVQLTSAADDGSGSGHAGWLCTYYVYDDHGNLRFVITPDLTAKLVLANSWVISLSQADLLAYRYEYDQLNRMIIEKAPGTPTGVAGETFTVYDQLNRVVMKQDGNMRSLGKWEYIQYDKLDRPVAKGLIVDANGLAYHLSNAAISSNNSAGVSAWPVLSSYSPEILSQIYYDNYSNVPSSISKTIDVSSNGSGNSSFTAAYNAPPVYAQPIVQSPMTQGLITEVKVEVLGTNGSQYIPTVNYYDEKGKIIQTQSINYTGGKDITTAQYDWAGKALGSLESHQYVSASNPQTHLLFSANTYDAMGRLLTVAKTINSTINGVAVSSSKMTIATNQYDEMGRLKTKALGNNLESLNCDYNVKGWLIGINRNYLAAGSTGHYFGLELGYDKQTSTAMPGNVFANQQFNGNVTGVVWKSAGDGIDRKYDYTYDWAERLMSADFNQQSSATVFDKSAGIDFSVSNLTYDANGNIQTMNRNGFLLGGSTQIDKLTYNYVAGNNSDNKLLNVIDAQNNAQSTLGDFHYTGSKTTASVDYTYDANGNILSDYNRSVSAIQYNYLDLPQLITVTGKGNIKYVYDASGEKLQKVATENNATVTYNNVNYTTNIITTTTYVNEFIYKSVAYSNTQLTALNTTLNYTDVLQFVGDGEGRIRYKPALGNIPASFVFDYFIRDNQGDVRMVLTDEKAQDIYPAATLEPAAIGTEQLYYSIVNDNTHVINTSTLPWFATAANHSYPNNNGIANPGNSNLNALSTSVYRLNAQTGDKVGLGITLKVMAGDDVSIMGKSVWHNTAQTLTYSPISSLLSTFIGGFASTGAVIAGSKGQATAAVLDNTVNAGLLTGMLNTTPNQPSPTLQPKAAVNWILFNDQFKPVAMGTVLVNSQGDIITPFNLDPKMVASGYLYVYCSNESNIDVFFDNLQVVVNHGPILEETHYYPDGLTMAGISDHAFGKLCNKFHYEDNEMQNQEWNDGTGLEEYDFDARYYDQQLGVWHSQDPDHQYASPYVAMGDSWPNGIDPDGKNFWSVLGDIVKGILANPIGYIGASLESGGHWNPKDWNSNWWKGAITADLVAAAIVVTAGQIAAPALVAPVAGTAATATTAATAATAGTGILGLSYAASEIAIGAAQGVLGGVLSTEVSSVIATGSLTPLTGKGSAKTWDNLFVATVSGAITGVLGSKPVSGDIDKLFHTAKIAILRGLPANLIGTVVTTGFKNSDSKGWSFGHFFDGSLIWPALGSKLLSTGVNWWDKQVDPGQIFGKKGVGGVIGKVFNKEFSAATSDLQSSILNNNPNTFDGFFDLSTILKGWISIGSYSMFTSKDDGSK